MDIVWSLLFIISIKVDVNALDRTLIPGESGGDVVRAVISKIETSNRFIELLPIESSAAPFMRTMAYVETKDGRDNTTGAGGIWNVSEALFDMTKASMSLNSVIMRLDLENISDNHVGMVTWRNLTYANLSIPLYSGLAVRMIIHLNTTLPLSTMSPEYWATNFKRGLSVPIAMNLWNDGIDNLENIEGIILCT